MYPMETGEQRKLSKQMSVSLKDKIKRQLLQGKNKKERAKAEKDDTTKQKFKHSQNSGDKTKLALACSR